jgi:hypothetical protein
MNLNRADDSDDFSLQRGDPPVDLHLGHFGKPSIGRKEN